MVTYFNDVLLNSCPLLDCYRVVVQVYMGSHEHLCPVDLLEDGATIGTVSIQRRTSWPELWRILCHLLTNHLQLVCGSWELREGSGGADIPLGLTSDSVASVKIGEPQKPLKSTTCVSLALDFHHYLVALAKDFTSIQLHFF